jgi:hypothetical protein
MDILITTNRVKNKFDLICRVRDELPLTKYLKDTRNDQVQIRGAISDVLSLCKDNYGKRLKGIIGKLNILPHQYTVVREGRCVQHYFDIEVADRVLRNAVGHLLVYGKGFNGFDSVIDRGSSVNLSYSKWVSILERCYSKKHLKRRPSYQNCTVSDDWLYYANFKKWFDKHYIEGNAIDKDILFKGNKHYSAETCVFVPQFINSLLVNRANDRGPCLIGVSKDKRPERSARPYCARVYDNLVCIHLGSFETEAQAFIAYKNKKEQIIQSCAVEYKIAGAISDKVYRALMAYRVEHDD